MYTSTSEDQTLINGDILETSIKLKNISGQGDLSNTVVTVPLPEGLKYKDGQVKNSWDEDNGTSEGISYDENTNTITINIGTLSIQKFISLNLEVKKFTGNATMDIH